MTFLARAGLAALALLLSVPAAHAAVFINELHYDDSTMPSDINETIEVVATNGEDLTQYSIWLYNGSNAPTAAPTYDNDVLPAGSIATCGALPVRFATVAYPSNGIQNGASDGIALVTGGNVVQFLSYEGVITALDGPAAGLTSTDIGQVESNATTPGTSLRLSGTGNVYANFAWQPSAASSFGACNAGQTFTATADVPPTVSSTVPADGSSTAQPGADVTVNFSEPVTVGATWYDISCDTSGAHTGTVTNVGQTSYTINPGTDFVVGESCTVTIAADQVTDIDGTPQQMDANYRATFTIGADAAPVVESTTPANLATNVAASANLTVKFSENVTVAPNAGWITISCASSGTHAATSDAGPSLYTVDPTVDFSAGEQCTVTVLAAGVTDVDGTPTPMQSNHVFSFTVAVGDAAPTVVRTFPAQANASTPWSADLSFFFSEAVTAPSNAFTISCVGSGTHTFAASTSTNGQRVLLNPTSDFNANEACTVTVNGAMVLDTDGTPTPMAGNYVMNFTTQPLATNYYAGVDASTCATLRTTLHAKIQDHVPYMYSSTSGLTTATATWNVLEDADEDVLNPNNILDIYRNRSYVKVTDRSGASDGAHYNREHTWPNSHGFNDTNGLDANGNAFAPYVDTHMLYLSAADYNANRGNDPYGDTGAGAGENPTDLYAGFGGGTGTYPGNSNWDGAGVYEVWGHRKGDAARAVLYMDIRYEGGNASPTGPTLGQAEPDLIVTDNASLIVNTASGVIAPQGYMGLKSELTQWHAQDAVDNAERLRNDIIYGYQGNRNPFIDHPEWVACLFDCVCTQPDPIFSNGFE